ncbi:hypothetical protein BB558_005835 [Smittium angustum]|uniref:histidinol-phosphate transaminase n=1 Tax=Smittium angustum TaxID=133377 RepID=A0A2U1IYY3_SMIAN|nr:hypothetical protein BB558_005959 [Smittium angustum]PVZ98166.1 hypothetical protein BB558_005835 [Smittium angustum]
MKSESFDIKSIVRPNILALTPYRSARDDYNTGILLDANENSFGPVSLMDENDESTQVNEVSSAKNPLEMHRYPDPLGVAVKKNFIKFRTQVKSIDNVFMSVGSDEVIDLVVRIFCKPGIEKVLITPPTYGMYSTVCQINDVGIVSVPLDLESGKFQLQVDNVLDTLKKDPLIKVIWLCSPGNPTGSLLKLEDIKAILDSEFRGIVIVDEAYIDFAINSEEASALTLINDYKNLLVMNTLSKSFGMAGARVGFGISSKEVIQIMNNVKAPYNMNSLSQNVALEALEPSSIKSMMRVKNEIINQRDNFLIPAFKKMRNVKQVLGTNDSNFVLVQFCNASGEPDNDVALKIYRTLANQYEVVVRYRGNEPGCKGCLRVTVGLNSQNVILLETLNTVLSSMFPPQ